MTETTHQDHLDPSTITTPLLLSLSVWFTCYYLSVLTPRGKPNGFESIWISNLNCLTLCAMAALSLLNLIPETIPSCWSSSFFIVDIIDCVIRRDLMWGFHGVISLVLNVCTASSPVHRGLRSASKGFFTEGSTPFLNYWKTHKTFNTYLIFFTSFAICRIVWVPIFAYNTYMIHLNGQFDYLIYPTVVFYLLQLAWFGKMIQMLWNYKSPEEIEKERHQVKKD